VPYVALEWDHKIGRPMINWIVVECAGVVEKCGGLSALAPRRDVAYFVNPKSAEEDAKAFAEYKNAQREGRTVAPLASAGELKWHAAYVWDHHIFSPLLRWGVLEWNGEHGKPGSRDDVAYFLDPDTAEGDAKWFSRHRDHRLAIQNVDPHAVMLSRKVG
jgi:hypothetical protein